MKYRLMRQDGSFDIDRIGLKTSWQRDLYHFLLSSRWAVFLLLLIGTYLLSNLLFSLLYALDAAHISHAENFIQIFFFSIQTMSTVGYGTMAPESFYTQVIMTLQLVFSFVFTAISTGMVFAKFSQVRARVLFSDRALIHLYEGKPVLTFRCANERSSQIIDATLRLTLARDEIGESGRSRRFYTLSLLRDSSPLFALVWNVYHVIDEASPLWGATPEQLKANHSALLITFNGMDEVLAQQMHTRYAYNSDEILFGERFEDIIGDHPDGRRFIDYRGFHQRRALAGGLPWPLTSSELRAENQHQPQQGADI